MADSKYSTLRKALLSYKDTVEFPDDVSEEYKKGFLDCIECVSKSVLVIDNLKNSEE